ncbi:hypothetical protein ACFO5R_15005 [Halosolutus amylolyticus]|uniref:Uncharacterized protein n=1 Tax=Halosolutus amylolyticus TaxID=2932267 RepID=A0ABD5PRR8_9EURY|nr:hypothetical protein [Halosolutus amylolyticus]
MDLETILAKPPDPRSHSFPDYSLPRGEPVMPIAVTQDELSTLLSLYETFAAVDPTGIDSNPFLKATTELLEQTFGVPQYRPDDQLNDDIAATLNDFSDDLGGAEIGVADATPNHYKALYFFLVTCRGYNSAPHVRFEPDVEAIDTLYRLYDRVSKQDMYLKRPETVFE